MTSYKFDLPSCTGKTEDSNSIAVVEVTSNYFTANGLRQIIGMPILTFPFHLDGFSTECGVDMTMGERTDCSNITNAKQLLNFCRT